MQTRPTLIRGLGRALAALCAAALAATCPVAAAGARGTAAGAANVDPTSVTFVSTSRGWVLGSERCRGAHACLALLETTDGGGSWSPLALPSALVSAAAPTLAAGEQAEVAGLQVRFADPRDGWIYGDVLSGGGLGGSIVPVLWSTHDGGVLWREARPPWLGGSGMLFDLEAAAGRAYLLGANDAGRVTLAVAGVTGDRWRILGTPPLGNPAGGGLQSGALVLQGGGGWLVEGNDRGTTGSARLDGAGRWVAWTPPCSSVGHSFAVPAAADARSLVAVCVMGGFAYPLSPAAPRGATIGSGWLYVSSDGGESFHAGPELNRRGDLDDGVLASPARGVVLLGQSSASGAQVLRASEDGGAHWSVVYRGQVTYLGFTTPLQGVGIAGAQGGRHA